MSTQANFFKLGVFVIAGVVCGLLGLVFLSVGQYLHEPMLIETYLDQSVQGLERGSVVKYRGVEIGRVQQIDFTRTRYEQQKPEGTRKPYILIEVAVDQNAVTPMGEEKFETFLKAEISRGLRFRLNAQGITGLSYLELDYVDAFRYPQLDVPWRSENLYIPSAPGTLTKLLSSVEQVFRKLELVDLGLVLTNLNRLLTTAETQIRGADLASINAQATQLLAELRDSNRALQGILKDPQWSAVPATAVATLEDVRGKLGHLDLEGTVARMERVLETAEEFLAGKESDLATTLTNLRVLTENLRAVSELVKAQPSSLLFGAPPRSVQPSP
jgi:ABC-type transporter Mla subunit MlaD